MITTVIAPQWENDTYNADIEPKVSIRLYGTFHNCVTPKTYDITFKIGYPAEYASYNFRYTGKIVNIGQKTVTILHGTKHQPQRSRLSLEEFASRNWDFDAAYIEKWNAIESQCI